MVRSSTLETQRNGGALMKLKKYLAIFLTLLAVLMSSQFVLAQGTDLGTITVR